MPTADEYRKTAESLADLTNDVKALARIRALDTKAELVVPTIRIQARLAQLAEELSKGTATLPFREETPA